LKGLFSKKRRVFIIRMSNPGANANITNREKWTLEAKSKQGWKCYFIERDAIYDLQITRNALRTEVQQLRTARPTEPEGDYEHLKQMFLTLYDKVGELCDCPICYETMAKDNTHVGKCGHLVCKDCKSRIAECPICRKKY